MDKKQAERIARHYLGDKLKSVCTDGYGGYTVFVKCANAYFKASDQAELLAGCERWHKMFTDDGWAPTHERLEWHLNRRLALLRLRVGNVSSPLWWIQIDGNGCYAASSDDVEPKSRMFANMLLTDVVTEIAEWCNKNLPYYLPSFPENKQ